MGKSVRSPSLKSENSKAICQSLALVFADEMSRIDPLWSGKDKGGGIWQSG